MAGNVSDSARRQAARDLGIKGVPATSANIAEQAAVGAYNDDTDIAPAGGAASADLGVGGPHSDMADQVQKRMDAARRNGPPAWMLQQQQNLSKRLSK